MLGALGALIRKDVRSLFDKKSDGLFVVAARSNRVGRETQRKEQEWIEKLGDQIKRDLLERWPFSAMDMGTEMDWMEIRSAIEHPATRIRVLYASEESHEWVVFTPYKEIKQVKKESEEQKNEMISIPVDTDWSKMKLNLATLKKLNEGEDGKDMPVFRSKRERRLHERKKRRERRALRRQMRRERDRRMKRESEALKNQAGLSESIHERTGTTGLIEDHDELNDSDSDFNILAGCSQKFNFEFGDGKFHDIISMAGTKNQPWSVSKANQFDPLVLQFVGASLDGIGSGMDLGGIVPIAIWHLIMSFCVDTFEPISSMMEVDLVLRDLRRWTQNLYVSPSLRDRDDRGDQRVRLWGHVFVEIGACIDHAYLDWKKQFSLWKKTQKYLNKTWKRSTNSFNRAKSVTMTPGDGNDSGSSNHRGNQRGLGLIGGLSGMSHDSIHSRTTVKRAQTIDIRSTK